MPQRWLAAARIIKVRTCDSIIVHDTIYTLFDGLHLILDGTHLLELLASKIFIGFVKHLLEMLDALVGEVFDVGDAPARDEGYLQITQPIERGWVGYDDRLEDTWRVAWSAESHLLCRR